MEFRIEEIIQNLVDAANRHDILVISRLVAKNVVFTEPFAEQSIIGREAYKEDIAGLFPIIQS